MARRQIAPDIRLTVKELRKVFAKQMDSKLEIASLSAFSVDKAMTARVR